MSFPINRAVAILTPLVFAPLAGSISVLAAKYLPGVDIDKGSVEAIFITGATIAFAKAGLWMKGWQDWEKREQEGAAADATGGAGVDDAADLEPDPDDGVDLAIADVSIDDEFVDADDIEDEVTADAAVPAGVTR